MIKETEIKLIPIERGSLDTCIQSVSFDWQPEAIECSQEEKDMYGVEKKKIRVPTKFHINTIQLSDSLKKIYQVSHHAGHRNYFYKNIQLFYPQSLSEYYSSYAGAVKRIKTLIKEIIKENNDLF